MAAIDTKQLAEQLKLLAKNPETIIDDEETRSTIQRLARQASIALESKEESMQRVMFAYLPLVTTRIANDFGIFAKLVTASESNPLPLDDLVQASGIDYTLVRAIMDYHVYHGAALEPKQYWYAPTRLTHNLLDVKVDKTTTCWHEVVGPAYTKLHQVLKTGVDEPGQKTAFQVAHRTTKTFYDFLESNPEKHSFFYGYMAAYHTVRDKWTDVLDFDQEIAAGLQPGQVAFVDIGGGDGSQSIEAKRVHELGGKIILQDRPAVIEKATDAKEAGIEAVPYDFFTEQPIKGAKAYFIQFVLLNWGNDEAVKILASQVPAMTDDSTLMLVDYVQSHRWEGKDAPREPDLWTPSTAIAAYSCHESKGRSSADYRALLEKAGLEMKECRIFSAAGQAVMIAKKKM